MWVFSSGFRDEYHGKASRITLLLQEMWKIAKMTIFESNLRFWPKNDHFLVEMTVFYRQHIGRSREIAGDSREITKDHGRWRKITGDTGDHEKSQEEIKIEIFTQKMTILKSKWSFFRQHIGDRGRSREIHGRSIKNMGDHGRSREIRKITRKHRRKSKLRFWPKKWPFLSQNDHFLGNISGDRRRSREIHGKQGGR